MASSSNTKFVIMSDEILQCLICTERLTPPIVQCKHGHYVCGKCKDKIDQKCPQCRSRISSIRCLAMERVLDLARPCPNPNFGEVIEVSDGESDGLGEEEVPDPNEKVWFYEDPPGEIIGPHTLSMLKDLDDQLYFQDIPNLTIWKIGKRSKSVSLKQAIRQMIINID